MKVQQKLIQNFIKGILNNFNRNLNLVILKENYS